MHGLFHEVAIQRMWPKLNHSDLDQSASSEELHDQRDLQYMI